MSENDLFHTYSTPTSLGLSAETCAVEKKYKKGNYKNKIKVLGKEINRKAKLKKNLQPTKSKESSLHSNSSPKGMKSLVAVPIICVVGLFLQFQSLGQYTVSPHHHSLSSSTPSVDLSQRVAELSILSPSNACVQQCINLLNEKEMNFHLNDNNLCQEEDSWISLVSIFSFALISGIMSSTAPSQGREISSSRMITIECSNKSKALHHYLPSHLQVSTLTEDSFFVQDACRNCIQQNYQNFDCILHSQPAIQSILLSMRSYLTSQELQNSQQKHALIMLSCTYNTISDPCQVVAMPFYSFAQQIPSSASSIEIALHSKCALLPICLLYAEHLKMFLLEFFPRSYTSLETFHDDYQLFKKAMLATYLVCTSSTSCLLPALLSNNFASITHSPTIYPWLSKLPNDLLPNPSLQLISSQVPLMLLTEYNIEEDTLTKFLRQSPSSTKSCAAVRGQLGTWVQDFDYARIAQYHLPLEAYAGMADKRFQPTELDPYRRPTTWIWKDHFSEKCPFHLLNANNLCNLLEEQSIERIFLLGDSLTFQMSQSLWKLLGYLHDFGEDKAPIVKQHVNCANLPNTQSRYKFEITFVRNDRLINVEKGPENATDKNCIYGYCTPWVDLYRNFGRKTLFIVNSGAHARDIDIYQNDFTEFLDTVDSFAFPQDIFYIRTTSPGHTNCHEPNLIPFSTYAEYKPTITNRYAWSKFVDYNDFIIHIIYKRSRLRKLPHVFPLDIYPMTVLRQDGHIGGSDCDDCGFENDCLHYSLPGPVDWWSHLLLNDLFSRFNSEYKF